MDNMWFKLEPLPRVIPINTFYFILVFTQFKMFYHLQYFPEMVANWQTIQLILITYAFSDV